MNMDKWNRRLEMKKRIAPVMVRFNFLMKLRVNRICKSDRVLKEEWNMEVLP